MTPPTLPLTLHPTHIEDASGALFCSVQAEDERDVGAVRWLVERVNSHALGRDSLNLAAEYREANKAFWSATTPAAAEAAMSRANKIGDQLDQALAACRERG